MYAYLTIIMYLTKRMKNMINNSLHFMELESHYGCNNYAPLKVVIDRAEGVYMYDCEGTYIY